MVSTFVDRVTGCHTNGVERAWRPLKAHWRQKKTFPCIDLILRYRHGYINIICSEVECDRTEL